MVLFIFKTINLSFLLHLCWWLLRVDKEFPRGTTVEGGSSCPLLMGKKGPGGGVSSPLDALLEIVGGV